MMLAECSLYFSIRKKRLSEDGDLVGEKRGDRREGEGGPYNSCSARQNLLRLCYRSVHSGPGSNVS